MSKKKEDYTIEDEIRDAMAGKIDIVDRSEDDPVDPNIVEDEEPQEIVKDVAKDETPKEEPAQEVVVDDPPPVSLSGAIKAKWNELPADVRAEWKKREDDIHRQMTAQDGDLAVGRRIKDIAAPYEAIIRSEGDTVENAFKDFLNTSYILRVGSPQQKAQAVMEAIKQFNVDLTPYLGNQHGNPVSALQQEIAHLRQQIVDPRQIKTQLQEELETDRIKSEIEAFAANPANVHFAEVKSIMGSLMASGKAKNLQEAYDSAIWSIPSIRAELEAKAQAANAEKKKAEMAAKKKAAASVSGSMGSASPSTNAPQKSLEDELREQMQAARGQI